MYRPCIDFTRTPEQLRDLVASWNRDDQAFFAAGACHILAFLFVQLHPDEGYQLRQIKPKGDYPGNHVYVSDGVWAFDHAGWTLEAELLDVTAAAHRKVYGKDWDFELLDVPSGLEDFCAKHYYRPPAYYLHLPWQRTSDYIKRFPPAPPQVNAST